MIDVFANDSDADGTLALEEARIVVQPQHGEVRQDRSTGQLVYFPAEGFVGDDFFQYTVEDDGGLTSNAARVDLQVTPGPGLAWQNADNRHDVNADGFLSSIDALLILNDINSHGARRLTAPQPDLQPPPFVDVSGDGFTTPLDALLVLNELNRIYAPPSQSALAEAEPLDSQRMAAAVQPRARGGRHSRRSADVRSQILQASCAAKRLRGSGRLGPAASTIDRDADPYILLLGRRCGVETAAGSCGCVSGNRLGKLGLATDGWLAALSLGSDGPRPLRGNVGKISHVCRE